MKCILPHSNGFSLVRSIIKDMNLNQSIAEFGKTLGEELLTPTRIYVKDVKKALSTAEIHAMSHITGGGFYENIPRSLPKNLGAEIQAPKAPPVFEFLAKHGDISNEEMYNVFNMGVGYIFITDKDNADKLLNVLDDAFVLGKVIPQSGIHISW